MPKVSIAVSEFAHAALEREAIRQGVSVEELLAHASMYYLADLHSGRLALRPLEFAPTEGQQRPAS